ncbi:4Fe-4S dicluster domain-containing protein [Carboxydothermus ferrireducens]|uniref:Carbon-monoxide dehydrogenase iron sulfur subunit n=1 Tax=Carboxydothermus ferrireducens DSM 11255 TaxID=1119529 RepID=A0ABX2R9Z6_9THEO|nr:4Fe-4S dicluster domain-containing protein [Carboxydothermus ferrireducens]NYE56603.1 carbon-monoxide dehydrogenase iron sulfur subunit [Carboxydothermus ferrireducens DSM 11255]
MREILVDLEKCLGCKTCELVCATSHSKTKELYTAISENPRPQRRIFVEANGSTNFPLMCRHCEDAPCVTACMSGALTKDELTGEVVLNSQRCIGCFMCVMVCPFGVIVENQHKAAKCDRCAEIGYPQCVLACPTKALSFAEVPVYAKKERKKYLTNFLVKE